MCCRHASWSLEHPRSILGPFTDSWTTHLNAALPTLAERKWSSSLSSSSTINNGGRRNLMGGLFSSSKNNTEEPEVGSDMALVKAKDLVSANPVMVFSKTYCGYCVRVKKLLTDLGANYKVIELDVESDGDAIQSALTEWTGQRTVPNVFIGGNHVGGCDKVTAKHNGGQLVPLLTDAGAVAKAGGSS